MDKFVLFADCSYVKSIPLETKLPPDKGNPLVFSKQNIR